MLRREESTLSDQETLAKGPTREVYVDFLRAFSLVMVVIWHWGFTILLVTAETVSPTNPIGDTRGMWTITWVLQVMPVFFFVGGYTHRLAFDNYKKGTSRRFLKRRTKRLLVPALGLIGIWVSLGFVLRSTIDAEWTWSAVILVLSPLWFLIVFLVLIAVAPLAIRARWRWGEIVSGVACRPRRRARCAPFPSQGWMGGVGKLSGDLGSGAPVWIFLRPASSRRLDASAGCFSGVVCSR